MKQTLFVILLFSQLTLTAYAQEKQWNMIKNNPEYIYGEGFGTTEAEADKNA